MTPASRARVDCLIVRQGVCGGAAGTGWQQYPFLQDRSLVVSARPKRSAVERSAFGRTAPVVLAQRRRFLYAPKRSMETFPWTGRRSHSKGNLSAAIEMTIARASGRERPWCSPRLRNRHPMPAAPVCGFRLFSSGLLDVGLLQLFSGLHKARICTDIRQRVENATRWVCRFSGRGECDAQMAQSV